MVYVAPEHLGPVLPLISSCLQSGNPVSPFLFVRCALPLSGWLS